MGKRFSIISIASGANNEWYHLCLRDINMQDDTRYLHIEPKGNFGEIGGGVEMSSDFKHIYDGPGYVLKEEHSKPLNQWLAGDIVSEQFYPEEFDERK